MSAPDTNTEKNNAAHKTPIITMIVLVIFVGLLLVGMVAWLFSDGDNPDGTDTLTDGVSTQTPIANQTVD